MRAYLQGFESLSFGASGAVSDFEAKQLEGGDGRSSAPTRTQRRRLEFAALRSGLLDGVHLHMAIDLDKQTTDKQRTRWTRTRHGPRHT